MTDRLLIVATSASILATIVGSPALGGDGRSWQGLGEYCLGRKATIVRGGENAYITGTYRADVIVAGAGNNVIRGGGGNDRICAGAGADLVIGGAGSDRIAGGRGNDTVEGGNGSDRLFGNGGRDVLIGNRGNDRLSGGAGKQDYADGGLGDDTVSGGRGAFDRVIGGVGNDRLYGGPGRGDVLRGDHGADLFDGGPGVHDVASFAVSGFRGPVGGGHGVVVDLERGQASQDGEDRLTDVEDVIGTAFDDFIRGSSDENAMFGGGGDDQLAAVGSGDAGFGGPGSDTCEGFQHAASCGKEPALSHAVVEADLAGGPAATSLTVVERRPGFVPGAEFEPEPDKTSVEVSFEAGAWIVRTTPVPVVGGDACVATGPSEARCAITGRPDAVLVSGGTGNDEIEIDPSVPATATAILHGDRGTDLLLGGRGDDSLNGAPRDGPYPTDILKGRGGDDALTQGALLDGGSGSDLLIAAPCVGQTVHGGPGIDSVSFARSYLGLGVQATLGGTAIFPPHPFRGRQVPAGCPIPGSRPTLVGSSVESIEGSPEDDILVGDKSANMLLGRDGNDALIGRGGNDFLVGGNGYDSMFGGLGWDRLYARDDARDRRLSCGSGSARRDVANVDRRDPPARGCRILP